MARRIAFINEKGGSGKTTLASNLASYWVLRRGFRVLAIDLDPQGQLGTVLGVEARRAQASALALLVDNVLGLDAEGLEERPSGLLSIVDSRIEGLDVILAGKELGLAPLLARDEPDPSGLLARRLSSLPEVDDYDFVLVDSPPSFGILTLNILRAVEELVIPVPLTALGLDGCRQLLESVEIARTRYGNRRLTISLVVPTFWRRTRLAERILAELRTRFPKELSKDVLGFDVKVDEAQSRGRSVFESAPSSRGARGIAALAKELQEREPALEGQEA